MSNKVQELATLHVSQTDAHKVFDQHSLQHSSSMLAQLGTPLLTLASATHEFLHDTTD